MDWKFWRRLSPKPPVARDADFDAAWAAIEQHERRLNTLEGGDTDMQRVSGGTQAWQGSERRRRPRMH